MHPRLQPHAGHADRVLNAFLVVDDEFLGQDVQDFLIGRNRDHPRRLHDPVHVLRRDFPVLDRGDAVGVEPPDVAAGNAGIHRIDPAVGHLLGRLNRALDRLHGGFDVDHHALLQPSRGMGADTDHLDGVVGAHLTDDSHHFRGADIESDDQIFLFFFGHHRSVAAA